MRRRSQRIMNKSPQPESDEDEADKGSIRNAPEVKPPLKKRKKKTKPTKDDNSSSSESDIGDYLQPADKIDLNSLYFETKTTQETSGSNNKEANLAAHWTRLSDSDSEPEDKNEVQVNQVSPCNNMKDSEEPSCSQIETSNKVAKLNFQQLQQFTTKIEEAKKHVEAYQARKSQLQDVKVEETNEDVDISDLLAIGEKAIPGSSLESISRSLHDSDFESLSDSEKEDWEEIKNKDHDTKGKEKERIKDGVQITVELPGGAIRKKKQVDLMAAVKRRLNRMRKENQVYVHKVHLLCWIAHGNFVNNVLNDVKILSSALSLLPSQKSYPSGRADLSYLEQLLQWFKKAVSLTEKPLPKNKELLDLLVEQIEKKQALNKRMLVYIFVALLRSIGLQCRLVLSFQVEPLRPPASDLHSLKTKPEEATKSKKKTDNESAKSESKSKSSEVVKNTKPKKTETELKLLKSNENSTRSSEKTKKDIINDKNVSQKSKNVEGKDQKSINLKKLKEASKNTRSNKAVDLKQNKTSKTRDSKIERNPEKLHTGNSEKLNLKTSVEKVESEKSQKSLRRSTRTTKDKSHGKSDKNEKSETLKGEQSTKVSMRKTSAKNKQIAQVDGFNDSDSEYPSFPKIYLDNPALYSSQVTSFRIIAPMWENNVYSRCRIPQLDGADDKISNSTRSRAAMPKIDLAKLKKSDKKPDTSKVSLKNKVNKEVKSLPSKKVVEKSSKDGNKEVKKPEFSPEPFRGFPNSGVDIRSDIIQIMKTRISEEKVKQKKRIVRRQKHKPVDVDDDDDDSDYVPESTKKKVHDSEDEFVPKTKVKRRIPVKRSDGSRKVLSSDDEIEKSKKKKGVDVWAEVFLEAEEKWISVDVVRGEVHCVQQLFNRATHPVSYIVAWNNDNSLKDVTMRYCNNFNTVTRKLRVDKKWWDETLKPFLGKKTARDREEDDELARLQLEKPLPTSIAEYKNHPLYALKRHLLKFEGIYPPDAATLGFVRGEPVYARDCVYTLCSRDIWLKSAKVVKLGEKPYKIVKARPKYDRLSNTMISGQMLELFGPWQTEDYDPPTAENGIVPRNAYGNVELFKPCMLPKKTVHLRLPGLNKIARKLNIDCASAIVGFDFHSGWSHPTYDGFVVCEEYADQLIAAWELDQEETERKETEKIEKRVYDNWKKLIKGLLIRERLQAKYEFGDSSGKKEKNKRKAEPLKSPKKKKVRKISSDSSDSDFVC